MKVQDLMSRNVLTIEPSDSCLDAVARMHQARVRHLPVVNREGMMIGVVTDRDLRHHLFSPRVYDELERVGVDILLKAVPVAEIMSTPVVSVKPDADLTDAARLMREGRVGSLPVIHGAQVVGIITETDLLRQICRIDATSPPACADVIVSYP